jgi:hypothetical protein
MKICAAPKFNLLLVITINRASTLFSFLIIKAIRWALILNAGSLTEPTLLERLLGMAGKFRSSRQLQLHPLNVKLY